jgi:(4S)-4-hydroxy-5-phosphonooxypentane-2,3-dione isomerase
MHAIFVTLKIDPSQRDRFLEAASDDATSSVRDEPGCLRFDIFRDRADPDTYHFLEVYADDEAFNAHGQTPHFARWRAAAAQVVAEPPTLIHLDPVQPSA